MMYDDMIERVRKSKQDQANVFEEEDNDSMPESWRHYVGVAMFGVHGGLDEITDEQKDYIRFVRVGSNWARRQASCRQLRAVEFLATVAGLAGGLPMNPIDPVGWALNALNAEHDGAIDRYNFDGLPIDEAGNLIEDSDDSEDEVREDLRRSWFAVDVDAPVEPIHVKYWLMGALLQWYAVKDLV